MHRQSRIFRLDVLLGTIMVAMGLVVAGLAFSNTSSRNLQLAQNTVPAPATTPTVPAGQDNGPAEAKPGGTRPTTPAPEPARPDADAQKAGAQPALPAAPAEKMGEPVKK